MNLSLAYRKMRGGDWCNGCMSTDIPSFAKAEQKKQEFSILKPDGNKTMRVLKTHESVLGEDTFTF